MATGQPSRFMSVLVTLTLFLGLIGLPTASAAGVLRASVPTISGLAKVGSKVIALPGIWGPAPVTLKYQWLRSGLAIAGATASTYTETAADLGRTLSVRVTGSKMGYTTAVRTSKTTTIVAPGTLTAPVPLISGIAKVGAKLSCPSWHLGTGTGDVEIPVAPLRPAHCRCHDLHIYGNGVRRGEGHLYKGHRLQCRLCNGRED